MIRVLGWWEGVAPYGNSEKPVFYGIHVFRPFSDLISGRLWVVSCPTKLPIASGTSELVGLAIWMVCTYLGRGFQGVLDFGKFTLTNNKVKLGHGVSASSRKPTGSLVLAPVGPKLALRTLYSTICIWGVMRGLDDSQISTLMVM